MSTYQHIQNNFTSGEISPRLYGRGDLQKYKNGVSILENWLVLPQGGVTRRPGTRFVGETKDSAAVSRLLPFKVATTQTYMLEFGNLYIRYYAANGRVLETAATISGAADNGSGLVRLTTGVHGYSTGDAIVVSGVLGTTEANGEWVVTIPDTTHIDLDTSVFANLWAAGGTQEAKRILTTVTTYTTAELPALKYAQDGDLLYLAHSDHAPATLSRTSATSFVLADLPFIGGPFIKLSDDVYAGQGILTQTMTPSATTGTITVTASAAFFTTAMANHYMRIGDGSGTPNVQGYVKLGTYSSNLLFTGCTVLQTLSGTGATSKWALGSWGAETGFPQVVATHQQRVLWGNTTYNPQTIFGSAIDNNATYDHVSVQGDSESYQFTVASTDTDVIRWIGSQQDLLVGTTSTEYSVTGGTEAAISAAFPPLINVQSRFGSSDISPIEIADALFYIQRAKRKIRALAFSTNDDAYASDDLMILANHLTDASTEKLAGLTYTQEPDSVAWVWRDDGLLMSMTWLKSQEVLAWGRHPMTNGLVESAAAIPRTVDGDDQCWLIIKRTINGATKRYVEFLDETLNVDSGLTGTINGDTIDGLSHLEGEVVSIIGDGAIYDDQTVSGGQVTVSADEPDITTAEAGIAYSSTLTTLEPALDVADGTSFGRQMRLGPVIARVTQTSGLTIAGILTPTRSGADLMDTAIPVEDGDIKVVNLGYANKGKITIAKTQQLPATVTALFGRLSIGELE